MHADLDGPARRAYRQRLAELGFRLNRAVGPAFPAMPTGRMNREQFFGQLATLDEQRLKKALWNLYRRGSAAMRERIEAEPDPAQHGRVKRPSKQPADPYQVLEEVDEFVALARSGAYMGR